MFEAILGYRIASPRMGKTLNTGQACSGNLFLRSKSYRIIVRIIRSARSGLASLRYLLTLYALLFAGCDAVDGLG
jgi:hypothetical protein